MFSKISLSDILAMIIPGGTILLFLSLGVMGFDLTFEHASIHSTFLVLIYVVFERQLKIYQRVWLDYKYLSK